MEERNDIGAGRTATAVAASGGKVYAAWCGPCNNQDFARGISVGNADGTGWHDITLPATGTDGTVPNRYLAGFAVDPKNADHVHLAVNGFSRHWTEGPGAGVGHVFESGPGLVSTASTVMSPTLLRRASWGLSACRGHSPREWRWVNC